MEFEDAIIFFCSKMPSWNDKNTNSSLTYLVYDKFCTYQRILMFLRKANI